MCYTIAKSSVFGWLVAAAEGWVVDSGCSCPRPAHGHPLPKLPGQDKFLSHPESAPLPQAPSPSVAPPRPSSQRGDEFTCIRLGLSLSVCLTSAECSSVVLAEGLGSES